MSGTAIWILLILIAVQDSVWRLFGPEKDVFAREAAGFRRLMTYMYCRSYSEGCRLQKCGWKAELLGTPAQTNPFLFLDQENNLQPMAEKVVAFLM